MARKSREYKNEANLEVNGIIIVSWYCQNKFQQSKNKEFKCSNCGNSYNHKHIYKLSDESEIELCYFCNQKIHNVSSSNPEFRKF